VIGCAPVAVPLPLHTERLTIRPFVEDDLDALHAIYGDRDAMRWVDGDYATVDDTERAMRVHIEMHALDGFAFWAVLHGEELVGEVGFGRLGDEIEMGWTFRRDAWGRGYATEAGAAALEGARPADRVIAVIRRENAASIRVAEKLGFALDGPRVVRGHEQLVFSSEPRRSRAGAR
jgi:RimJ/RimL family protein N-acetyltransferase